MSSHATLYDFRDMELMFRLAEEAETNGTRAGVTTPELAQLLGFDEGDNRPMGIRLAWMKRYGMVLFDPDNRTWRLTAGGRRVVASQVKAKDIAVVDRLPDESMVDVMAHVTSRFRTGQPMIATMLRREFLYGTQRR